jgi:hypothetical protein
MLLIAGVVANIVVPPIAMTYGQVAKADAANAGRYVAEIAHLAEEADGAGARE